MSSLSESSVQPGWTVEVGQDGKRRPTSVEGVQLQRARIGELITATPDASDRQIARQIGCSPSTVSGVRKSLSNQVGHSAQKQEPRLDTVQRRKTLFERMLDLWESATPAEQAGARHRVAQLIESPNTVQAIWRDIEDIEFDSSLVDELKVSTLEPLFRMHHEFDWPVDELCRGKWQRDQVWKLFSGHSLVAAAKRCGWQSVLTIDKDMEGDCYSM
jgi:hypothetical protein